MNKYFLPLLCFIAPCLLFAQEEKTFCGTDELRYSALKNNSALAAAVAKREQRLENFTRHFIEQKNLREETADTALYIIPVVFHIIHNYGNENISNEQIYDAVDVLNKTFRKQRADTTIIVDEFKPIHADTRIEFRLAKRDPNGNCHSGINRIASHFSETGGHEVKTLVQWNPASYLNIYVVKNAAGLAGHAIFPSDADTVPAWDGIVISHNYTGSIGTSNPLRSVVLAHECGHYLNLQHIWGGNNVPGYYFLPCADPNHDCNIDDGVDDTPRTIGWQSCNLSGATCGSALDNVQNVMDYSYCNIMFTQGQRDRMQAALNSSSGNRNNLWQVSNLIATGVYDTPVLCEADFASNKKVMCPGGSVNFNNLSYHPPFASVLWTFTGGTPVSSTDTAPTVTYSAAGSFPVSLRIISGNDSVEITKNNFIKVLPQTGAQNFPFSESFETTNSLNNDWLENSFDEENSWEITTAAAFSGNKSVMLAHAGNTMETKDELYSPLINLSQASSAFITFKYAFAAAGDSAQDILQVQINKNCANLWLNRLDLTGSDLQTAPSQMNPFFPSGVSQWKQASINIPSSYFENNFRFRFVFHSRGGNNVFIDDINIDVTSGIGKNEMNDNRLVIFPNPASEIINISLPGKNEKMISLKILDAKGSLIQRLSNVTTADVSALSSGMYFLIAETEKSIYRQRFIKD